MKQTVVNILTARPDLKQTAQESLSLIQQLVGEACQKAGYSLSVRVNPKSKGHRLEVKVFDGDLVVYHCRKIRISAKVDPSGQVQSARSPRPLHLMDAINRVLEKQGRRLLEEPAKGDSSAIAWILYG